MGKKIDISQEEMIAYRDKISSKKYMTLNDIIEIYYEFNTDTMNDDNDSFESRKKADIGNFSKKFKSIQNAFGLENRIFERTGAHKGYSFSGAEALFVRELYIRSKTRKIWNEIIAVRRTEKDGFYKAYKETENKKGFFEELTFFIDGILRILRTEAVSESQEEMRRYLYTITQYQIIESHKPIYDVQSEIYESLDEIHQLIDKIQVLPPKYVSKLRGKIYSDYIHAIRVLGCEIDNEIFKFRQAIAESILQNFVSKKIGGNILKKATLQKIVDNMKDISPALYSELKTENMYAYLNNIDKNVQEYLLIYIEEKKEKDPDWEEEALILSHEIKNHLFEAINKLSEEDFRLLEDECHKATKL